MPILNPILIWFISAFPPTPIAGNYMTPQIYNESSKYGN